MADKNIDESIRKPRRTKGTPFYAQRNYYALGAIVISAATWVGYEYWSQTRTLKHDIEEGKFKYPVPYQEHILSMQRSTPDPAIAIALAKLREKIEYESEKSKPQPWFSKLFNKQPDL